ncbi:MAG: hypothetical protein ACRD12_04015 [Acidimicrobiales bacterium]
MHKNILAAVMGLVVLAGCGRSAPTAVAGPADEPAYEEVAIIVEKLPTCSEVVPLVAPTSEAARDFSYFRYLDGRIYEFGPCEARPNELRVYRYATSDGRDAALRAIAQRGTRPTATFAFRDVWALEIWSPDPSPDSAVGQVVAQVHFAIGRTPGARHLDLVAGAA